MKMSMVFVFVCLLSFVSCSEKNSELKKEINTKVSKEVKKEKSSKEELLLEKVNPEKNSLITNMKQITFGKDKTYAGEYNRNRSMFVFEGDRSKKTPFSQVYLFNGKKTKVLSSELGVASSAHFHPYQQKVLFSSSHFDVDAKKKMDKEIENRKNKVQKRYGSYDEGLDLYEKNLRTGKLTRLTKAKGYDSEANYSTNGRYVVFSSNRRGYGESLSADVLDKFKKDSSYLLDIYLLDRKTNTTKRLTQKPGYDGSPVFNYNSDLITWQHLFVDGHRSEIFTMKRDGSDLKQVTNLKALCWSPSFHPSGDYIIFGTSVHDYHNFELYIVDIKGDQKPVRVTNIKGRDGSPRFSADGKKLIWTRKVGGVSQLVTADWDDLQARELLKLTQSAPKFSELTPAINSIESMRHIYYLASEELQGRDTGSKHEDLYQNHYIGLLKKMGLKPFGKSNSFQQKFDFVSGVSLGKKNSLIIDGTAYKVSKDWLPTSFSKVGKIEKTSAVFVGYGLKVPEQGDFKAYNSYDGVDVKDKWVIAFRYLPEELDGEYKHHISRYSKIQHKAMIAREYGAKGLILVSGPTSHVKSQLMELKYEGGVSNFSIPVISITDELAQNLLGEKGMLIDLQGRLDKGKKVPAIVLDSTKLEVEVDIKHVQGEGNNILAMLRVSGATKTLVIGAHADHLGKGKKGNSRMSSDDVTDVHYGADDNASGVTGVMEMAHFFSDFNKKNPGKLRRNILFTLWSGEEIGLLGSSHFVNNFKKQFNSELKDSVVAYLNMDMIGRLRDKLMIQAVDSSTNWEAMVEKFALTYDVPLDIQRDPYVPSDGMNFYLGGVPSLTFFTGSHKEYHTPRDTADTIDYDGMVKVIKLVRDFAFEISTTTMKIDYNKLKGNSSTSRRGSRKFRVYLGTIPDYTAKDVKGVKLSGTTDGGPASIAGITKDDVIIKMAGKNIENIYDYVYALQTLRPESKTSVTILRDGKEIKLSIIPKAKD